MNEVAVSVQGLGKSYRIYDRPADRLLELLTRRPRHRLFPALEGTSFELFRGEGLGIIGENGAGKSTLLKILAGVTPPGAGSFAVRGKVAAILELGSGFHPDFTGRQNTVLNAALLGLSEKEVALKLPGILEFSELGEFIDQPVKTYSTGMAMRLAFSIATQVDPEVLIIDEALSVGDGYFQKKCLDRLRQLIEHETTVLFCSHAMYYVSSLCDKALWLRGGRVERLGPAIDVVQAYEEYLVAKQPREEGPSLDTPAPSVGRITRAELLPPPAATATYGTYAPGAPWGVEVGWESDDPEVAFHLGVGVNRRDGVEVCSFSTERDGLEPLRGRREYCLRLELPELPMVKGEFTVYLFLLDAAGLHVFDQRILDGAFRVVSDRYLFGLVDPPHRWEVVGKGVASAGAPGSLSASAPGSPAAAGEGSGGIRYREID